MIFNLNDVFNFTLGTLKFKQPRLYGSNIIMTRRPATEFARISTMPRPNTEARGYLDRYQMAIEKARLEKELDLLETRRTQIHRRLQQVSHSLEDLNHTPPFTHPHPTQSMSDTTSDTTHGGTYELIQPSTSTDSYQTFVLEF